MGVNHKTFMNPMKPEREHSYLSCGNLVKHKSEHSSPDTPRLNHKS